MEGEAHGRLVADLTRRSFLRRASELGLAAVVGSAVAGLPAARAALPSPSAAPIDATLQAFADTIVPGRRVARTESGQPVHPQAIAGVDPLPGAVEADALALYHHPETGFDALEPTFLADLQARTIEVAPAGVAFLELSFDARVRVCLAGLDFSNPTRIVWEAAAAVPFTAFCAAALVPEQTAAKAVGYRVMGLPGRAPGGYSNFSFGRRLARERTNTGSLPG